MREQGEGAAETPDERRLAELNRTIERLEARVAELEQQRAAAVGESARHARRDRYLRLALLVRAPAKSYELWPVGVLLVAPLLGGILLSIPVHVLLDSLAATFFTFLAAAAVAGASVASLLYRPAQSVLIAEAAQADAQLSSARSRLEALLHELAAARQDLTARMEQRRELMASGKVQRAALLQRPWKAMPPGEWEDFVVEVCRTLGAPVERSKPGVLVITYGGRHVAAITRGEGHIAKSSAVQEAVAAQEGLHVDSCAVILNHRFTGAAQDFAHRKNCTLIGPEEFPDFVMGRREL